VNSPFKWFGGKSRLSNEILPYIPKHYTYVEVFGGGASLLFTKPKSISQLEVYNDINSDLVNFFRVLRNPEKFKVLYSMIEHTPYSREEYNFCLKNYNKSKSNNPKYASVGKAHRWFIVASMCFSGHFGAGWSYTITNKMNNHFSRLDCFKPIHDRLVDVQIEHKDFEDLISTYDTPNTFFYLDPPYIGETRKAGKYVCEITDKDHERLVDILLNIKGKAILSGYKHLIYNPLIKNGWKSVDFDVYCHVAATKERRSKLDRNKRIETIWLSPGIKELLPKLF